MINYKIVSNSIITAVFLVIIIIPCLFFCFDIQERGVTIHEKRKLSALPDFNWNKKTIKNYPKAFEKFYNDHFYFRNILIDSYNWFMLNIWKESPSKKVVVGKKGWLYYSDSLKCYRTNHMFTKRDLENWQSYIEIKKNWLEKKGISYHFVVVPNKATIYPEFLPVKYNSNFDNSILDQLILHLSDHSHTNIIDLRKGLLNSKKQFILFYQKDTHWNHIGSYYGYRQIINELNRHHFNFNILNLSQFDVDNKKKMVGDLAWMIGKKKPRENKIELVPNFVSCGHKEQLAHYLNESWPDNWQTPYSIHCNSSNGKLIAIGDSFLMGLKTFIPKLLGEHFETSIFLNREQIDIPKFVKIIEKEKPDIVLEEIAERNLLAVPNEKSFKLLQDIITH